MTGLTCEPAGRAAAGRTTMSIELAEHGNQYPVPSDLPLPPLMAPMLSTLLAGDPSFDESSTRLSQMSAMRGGIDDHPGRRLLDALPHHRTIASHEMVVRPAGAGVSVLKPVRTLRSAPDLSMGGNGSMSSTGRSSRRESGAGGGGGGGSGGGPGGSGLQPQSAPRSFQVFHRGPLCRKH